MASSLQVATHSRRQVVDLTERVQSFVPPRFDGVCALFLKHTTAALTLAALQDSAGEDLLETLPKLVPSLDFRHLPAEHVPSHVLSAIIGASLTVPVEDGRLVLGGVQRIVLLDFEGPGQRDVDIRFLS
jgi:secondary thiamine-phosphate synthase enzyme